MGMLKGRRSQSGSAALEFGLVAPVIFLLIFGIIQYGYLFWALQTSAATAREAARSLIVGTEEDCTLAHAVDMAAGPAVGGGTPTATATYRDAAGAAVTGPVEGGLVQVTVGFDTLDMSLPFLPLPDGGHVTQSAESRVENVPPVPLACD
jgi:Flp pilus assembly protein TadG